MLPLLQKPKWTLQHQTTQVSQRPLTLPEHWGALEKGVSQNNAGVTLLEQHICFCLVLSVQPHGRSLTPRSQHTHITCTVPQGSSSHAHPKRDGNTIPHATAVQLQYMATGTCRSHRKSPQKGLCKRGPHMTTQHKLEKLLRL